MAAVSLTKLVPEITSLSQFEFLKFIHALIYGWDYFSALIANALNKYILYYYISIRYVHVNVFIYFSTIVDPLIYSKIKVIK